MRVGLSGGASYPAHVVGADPSSDLAVVRLDKPPAGLRPLGFDSSGGVQPGDPVYAIGNPFGLDSTMTAGIVSATGRDIKAPDGLTIPNAIQTDAPINHGNSGGPLIDAAGKVVGVASQIQGGTVDANVGVGFAIPGDTVRSVARPADRQRAASRTRGSAPASPRSTRPSRTPTGAPVAGRARGQGPAGSPAEKAGLQAGRLAPAPAGRPSRRAATRSSPSTASR